MADHRDYLALLEETGAHLVRLTELAQQKTAAVRRDDLNGLNEVMKQEQAISLALRGLEGKRIAKAAELGMDHVRISQMAGQFPEELQPEARHTAETLLRQYKLYQSASEVARNTLECNLHEIEKIIVSLGGDPYAEGVGYESPDVEPPAPMRADFRA